MEANKWIVDRLTNAHRYGSNDGLNDYLFVNGLAGFGTNYGQYYYQSGSWWRGANGKWNPMSWGGNGFTRGRSVAIAKSGAFRVAGRVLFFASAVVSGYQGYQNYQQGNYWGMAKNGLDIGMSAATTFGGPIGVCVGGVYFVGDAIGWGNIYRHQTNLMVDAEKKTGMSWSQMMGPIYE
jgi:hypothetical protein